jgi:hypothetical protein
MSEEEGENIFGDDGPDRNELLNYLSEFMREGRHMEKMYRENFCELVVNKIFEDFGYEGLCNLMVKIDGKANWISDILIENSDLMTLCSRNTAPMKPRCATRQETLIPSWR